MRPSLPGGCPFNSEDTSRSSAHGVESTYEYRTWSLAMLIWTEQSNACIVARAFLYQIVSLGCERLMDPLDARRYPERPIPGVGAVVVGRLGVLLVRRDKDPGEGLWSIPGGVVELGESQHEAVTREVLEETGVHVEVIRMIDTADLILHDERGRVEFHYVLNHYLARALDESLREESPSVEVSWFHPDELPSDMPDILRGLISSVRRDVDELMSHNSRQ